MRARPHSENTFHAGPTTPPGLTGQALRLAVFGDLTAAPELVARLLHERSAWHARAADALIDAAVTDDASPLPDFDVAILIDRATADLNDDGCDDSQAHALRVLDARHIATLVITHRPSAFAGHGDAVVCVAPNEAFDAVRGALVALAAVKPAIAKLNHELANIRHLGQRLEGHYQQVDRDLYLASRLQHDFLPRALPEVGAVRFSTFFRPCSLVSGDIFDITRLDEAHIGFYLADAVGHGVAAGLLTMYIKHAIRPKRIRPDGYDLLPPAEVLAALNDHLVAQCLPESQFVTAWYGKINARTLTLDYGVAGHPPALLVDPNGSISELRGDGCLLGVFGEQPFHGDTIQLRPGQRVCIYSDGLESTLIEDRMPAPDLPIFAPGVAAMLRLPAEELIHQLQERLDDTPGGLTHADDVSMLIVDALDSTDDTPNAKV